MKIRQQGFSLLLTSNISGLLLLFAILALPITEVFSQTNWMKDTLNNPVMVVGSSGDWDWQGVIPGTILFDGALPFRVQWHWWQLQVSYRLCNQSDH